MLLEGRIEGGVRGVQRSCKPFPALVRLAFARQAHTGCKCSRLMAQLRLERAGRLLRSRLSRRHALKRVQQLQHLWIVGLTPCTSPAVAQGTMRMAWAGNL